jgi:rare lipoprotein A
MRQSSKMNKHRMAVNLCLSGVFVVMMSLPTTAVAGQCGGASWYALDGRRTANGEVMNSSRLTAAHRSLPFGSRVRVKNMRNGRSVVVRINDRGPFVRSRVIDVSKAAARRLGFISRGVTRVCISR